MSILRASVTTKYTFYSLSTHFVLLHSQSNQAAVILALLTASLLEGVEVVRHSEPQHTALILAIVLQP
jgi:hypothetical protein